jgi:hypothetical protein
MILSGGTISFATNESIDESAIEQQSSMSPHSPHHHNHPWSPQKNRVFVALGWLVAQVRQGKKPKQRTGAVPYR